MRFADVQAAETRLRTNTTKLTAVEIRALMEWAHQLSIPAERRLSAELSLQNLEAVQTFEKSSGKLTLWLIGLTAVLLLLTVVIAWFSYILAKAEHHTPAQTRQPEAQQQSTPKRVLGPWQGKLAVPGSLSLPSDSPVIKLSTAKTPEFKAGYLHLTFANLSDRSYTVKYVVLGYNGKGQRISQGTDQFLVGRRESVVRQDFLGSEGSVGSNPGSSFVVRVQLEEQP